MIRLIAAIDRKRGIGKNSGIPWAIPEDSQYFTDQTKTHGGHVLTGGSTFRDTYGGKPLVGRENYLLTHDDTPVKDVVLVSDLEAFLKEFSDKNLWVAGGAAVFEAVMKAGKADELYLTHIDAEFGCDRFFPEYEQMYTLAEQSEPKEQNGFHFTYARYLRNK